MGQKYNLLCNICNVQLQLTFAHFTYLDKWIHKEVLRCPKCGQIYLSESFTKEFCSKVETKMEDDFRTLNN